MKRIKRKKSPLRERRERRRRILSSSGKKGDRDGSLRLNKGKKVLE